MNLDFCYGSCFSLTYWLPRHILAVDNLNYKSWFVLKCAQNKEWNKMAFPVLLQLGAGACWGDDSHHLSSGSCTDVSIMQGEQHAFSEFCFQKVKGKWWRGQASFLFFVFFFFLLWEGTGSCCYQQTAFSTSAFVSLSLLFSSSHNTHHFFLTAFRAPVIPVCQGLRGFRGCGTFVTKSGKIKLRQLDHSV